MLIIKKTKQNIIYLRCRVGAAPSNFFCYLCVLDILAGNILRVNSNVVPVIGASLWNDGSGGL